MKLRGKLPGLNYTPKLRSESMVRIHAIESLRFPGEGSSAQGKSGPKERPKSVSDGQQVEIPALRNT